MQIQLLPNPQEIYYTIQERPKCIFIKQFIYMTEKYKIPDERPMLVCESNGLSSWGGSWTEQKLETFESYVRAYLTIMNSYRDKHNWKLIYFDGFAGSGTRSVEEEQEDEKSFISLFGEEKVEKRELSVYQGAAERIVNLERKMRGFDFYYFIDKEEENCAKLKLKLSPYKTKGIKQFRPGDANEMTLSLANALKKDKHLKALCFLDPFGMSIKWNTIKAISRESVDLWILLPSGVIINRLIKTDGTLMYPQKLVEFFGMSEDEIKQWFYEHKEEQTLFGAVEWYEKKNNPIKLIANLFCERLGELFPHVTNEPLVMRNNHNVPIFHFVCASFNKTAVKIAQQIIDKRQ